MRSSSDWVQTPKGSWVRAETNKSRGPNWNFNRTLKQVFKGAATTVIALHPDTPLHRDYKRMLADGMKPNLAKLTLARKIAAIALAMWKRKEVDDPARYAKSAAGSAANHKIKEISGHKSDQELNGYIRDELLFEDNAAGVAVARLRAKPE